jgi:hypothetical protein
MCSDFIAGRATRKPPFSILTLPLVYGLEITTCRYKCLLQELVVLCYCFLVTWVPTYSAMVSLWLKPLLHLVDQIMFCVFPHTTKQDSQPTTPLISKQAVPYQTCGSTWCPVVSTPKTRSIADSSITNHNTWRNPTVSTIPTHAQTTVSNLATITSHHDVWKTNTLNTYKSQTQHYKDGKTCSTTQDCRAKQYY